MSADGNAFLPGLDTRMTRRSLLLSLPAVAMARKVLTAQGSAGTLKIRAFNHMTISVAIRNGRSTLPGALRHARDRAPGHLKRGWRVGSGPRSVLNRKCGAR